MLPAVRSVRFGVKFAQFYLCEPVQDPFQRTERPDARLTSGLLSAVPGMVQCMVGAQVQSVALTAETHRSAPAAYLDDYEDVVELSYLATQAELDVVTWGEGRVEGLPLPAGQGSYRIRYHLRDMDPSGKARVTADGCHVGECLLQIWPAPTEDATQVKITSMAARFWHPTESSHISFGEAGLISPNATPEALAALKRCGLL
ncbi:hypothetical protein ACFQ68_06855 [Amycolatopsis japonica]|uniref:hypothetical protein n=1 Tax=Amycolatopsis japonica TaxID=208439 RepID=UPI003671947F